MIIMRMMRRIHMNLGQTMDIPTRKTAAMIMNTAMSIRIPIPTPTNIPTMWKPIPTSMHMCTVMSMSMMATAMATMGILIAMIMVGIAMIMVGIAMMATHIARVTTAIPIAMMVTAIAMEPGQARRQR